MMRGYDKFEKDLEKACGDIQESFITRFKDGMYLSPGGSKLDNFITDLQKEYEALASAFIKENNLENDVAARKRVLTIAKQFARKCTEEFSKIK